jgi:beta-lactamase regulating signal transducer with metallopeptidase domain
MIEDIFKVILTMSISSSVVIGIVMLTRFVFKNKLSKSFSYGIWLIVLVRLVIPISIESPLSIFNYLPLTRAIGDITSDVNDEIQEEKSEGDALQLQEWIENNGLTDRQQTLLTGTMNYENSLQKITGIEESAVEEENVEADEVKGGITPDSSSQEKIIKNSRIEDFLNEERLSTFMRYASVVWLLGLGILIAYYIVSCIMIKRRLTDVVLFKSDLTQYKVYRTDKIQSPILVGIMTPRIILPIEMEFSNEQLEYIVKHEMVHIQRFDYLIKPLAFLVACLHWFNPFVWGSYYLAMQDMELSCDERVLLKSEDAVYSAYADTLLKISMHQNGFSFNAMVAFGEKNIKTRIKSILNFKKMPRYLTVLSGIVILLLAVMLITSGTEHKADEVLMDLEEETLEEETLEEETLEEEIETIEEVMGYHLPEENIIDVVATEVGTFVFYEEAINENKLMYCFDLLEETTEGYKWIAGGQLENAVESDATLQFIQHLTDAYSQGLIYGITSSDASKIDVTKGVFYSTMPFVPETINFGENLTLWYCILPDDFGEFYDVVFSNDEEILFIKGNRDFGTQNEATSKNIYQTLVNNKDGTLEINFSAVRTLAESYNYEWGTVLSVDEEAIELLLYNQEENVREASVISCKREGTDVAEEKITLNEQLVGYRFETKYTNYTNQKYILGIISRMEDKTLYSSLVYIPKNDLSALNVIESFVQGEECQSVIPTIFDNTVELVEDYIFYQDVDKYWKVKNIVTGERYISDVNEVMLGILKPYFYEGQCILEGQYIYLCRYIEDSAIFAFDTQSKEFLIIENSVKDINLSVIEE